MRVRPRRNRKNELIRKMVEETVLRPANLIYPLFLLEGDLEKQAWHHAKEYDVFLVAGGDGTISEVVNGMMKSEIRCMMYELNEKF